MKKIFKTFKISSVICALLSVLCIGIADAADLDMQIQIANSDITKKTSERDEKLAKLQDCERNTKGFKIAGITTLALTGVGVGVNVNQAIKKKELDADIKVAKAEKAKREAEQREAELKKANEQLDNKYNESQTALEKAINNLNAKQTELDSLKKSGANPEVIAEKEKEVKELEERVEEEKKGFECPATSNYPGANGKKLGDKCEYSTGKYFGEDRGGVAEGVIYRAASSCYCHAKKCADDNYEIKSGKCMPKTSAPVDPPADTTPAPSSGGDAGIVEALEVDNVPYHGENANVIDGYLTKARTATGMSNLRLFATCTTNEGTYAVAGNPGTTFGENCWCKGTKGSTAQIDNKWVFYWANGSPAGCAKFCAYRCALYVAGDSDFRSAVVSALAP